MKSKRRNGGLYVQGEMWALERKLGVKKSLPPCHASRRVTRKDYIQLPLFQYMISGQGEMWRDQLETRPLVV